MEFVLTNPRKLDVDEALEQLVEHAGPSFRQHVQDWGAIHADKRQVIPVLLADPEL